jgi:hypothetical protein
MSLNNPIQCRNCGADIYFDPPGVRGRPFDVETQEYHRCIGGSGSTNSKGKTPVARPCKFDCGTMIVYDTKEGFYHEGNMSGPKHNCANIPKESGQQLLTTPQKGSSEQIAHDTQIHKNIPIETIKANLIGTTAQYNNDLGELLSLIRELNTLQLGISQQLKNIADNQDLNNRMTRAIRDILQEYKDEVIDTIKKPSMKFESGNKIEDPASYEQDNPDDDIYNEFADTDDKTHQDDV